MHLAPKMVEFTDHSADLHSRTYWGHPDAREGGIPDPTTAGPDIIQIGNEGGMLPAANGDSFHPDQLRVQQAKRHGAERSGARPLHGPGRTDRHRGRFLPLRRQDPDPLQRCPGAAAGGRPAHRLLHRRPGLLRATAARYSTLPGFGPNTRTIMQINVTGTVGPNGTSYDRRTWIAALPAGLCRTPSPGRWCRSRSTTPPSGKLQQHYAADHTPDP